MLGREVRWPASRDDYFRSDVKLHFVRIANTAVCGVKLSEKVVPEGWVADPEELCLACQRG